MTIQRNLDLSANGTLRGHPIYFKDGAWLYCDDNSPTSDNPRNCNMCNKPDTKEGHDPCIANTPGAINACCGHGNINSAYVQLSQDEDIRGEEAIIYFQSKNRFPHLEKTEGIKNDNL